LAGFAVTTEVFADFHNVDMLGRLRLNCAGTEEDLAGLGIELTEGLSLVLYSEELEAEGTVVYSQEEQVWAAVVDWNAIRGAHPGFKPSWG
jgi:hypothetical protein